MDNNPKNLSNQNPNQQVAGMLQKWQFPSGIIFPLALAATPVVAEGDLYYSSGSIFVRLPITNNAALTSVNNIPIWQAGYTGIVTIPKITTATGSLTVVNGIITAVVQPT